MQHLEGSGTPVQYIGRTVLKDYKHKISGTRGTHGDNLVDKCERDTTWAIQAQAGEQY